MTSDAKAAVEDLIDRIESSTGRVTAEDIEPYLDHDEQVVRKRAADAAFAVASNEPDEIVPLVDRLIEMADDGFIANRQSAFGALGAIAAEDPAAVEDGFDTYVEGLQDSTPRTRIRAARSFALVVGENPELAVGSLDDIVAAVDVEEPDEPVTEQADFAGQPDPAAEMVAEDVSNHEFARELASNALVDAVEVAPEAVAEYADAIRPWLDDGNTMIVSAAIDVYSALAAEGYDLPDDLSDHIEAGLVDAPVEVQARAIRALGYLEATDAADTLRDLAQTTDEDELASLATDTADYLDRKDDPAE